MKIEKGQKILFSTIVSWRRHSQLTPQIQFHTIFEKIRTFSLDFVVFCQQRKFNVTNVASLCVTACAIQLDNRFGGDSIFGVIKLKWNKGRWHTLLWQAICCKSFLKLWDSIFSRRKLHDKDELSNVSGFICDDFSTSNCAISAVDCSFGRMSTHLCRGRVCKFHLSTERLKLTTKFAR